jgi:glutathione S-transferase
MTIADLLYFYEITNLAYYRVDHISYPTITQWYSKIMAIPEVATIMAEWKIMAEDRARVFEKILPIRNLA